MGYFEQMMSTLLTPHCATSCNDSFPGDTNLSVGPMSPRTLHGRLIDTSLVRQHLCKFRFKPWFWNKKFSVDWTTEHLPVWHRILADRRRQPVRIVEIGSWEGRSAVFFLKYFKYSKIVCIDTFDGTESLRRHPTWGQQIASIESCFDYNLAQFGDRVEKIKRESKRALDDLLIAGRKFDLAYIDGDHKRDNVWEDTVRTWELVQPGGIIIWDDYGWPPHYPSEDRPQAAIDYFLASRANQHELLEQGYQVIVRRVW